MHRFTLTQLKNYAQSLRIIIVRGRFSHDGIFQQYVGNSWFIDKGETKEFLGGSIQEAYIALQAKAPTTQRVQTPLSNRSNAFGSITKPVRNRLA